LVKIIVNGFRGGFAVAACWMLAGCSRPEVTSYDSGLMAEIQKIKAFDNHAHPVRVTSGGEEPDRGFDALPVDNMEPASDPLMFRPHNAEVLEAAKALYGSADPAAKQRTMAAKGAQYPEWVLDQMGVEIMLANRVAMGSSIQPPRFHWVSYVDALMFPLDNSKPASENPDRKAFFALEDQLLHSYLGSVGLTAPPATLAEYTAQVVTPTLERQKKGGAVAVKFEAAYLRSLEFNKVDEDTAEKIYGQARGKPALADTAYKPLQDYLFRYIASECGRLGMAVHLHTMAGAGSYFRVAGANPLLLESVLNDPDLRKTKIVMVHGGWPFTREITALLEKPTAYLDFSAQDLSLTPATLAVSLRQWLEFVPEKVLFGTDAYPYSSEMGWEESGWVAAKNGREALAIALTGMLRDGEISRSRASELAHMVLRENARALYSL
jgi:predicted TIM-barrel fold metal-dependent hydrolase